MKSPRPRRPSNEFQVSSSSALTTGLRSVVAVAGFQGRPQAGPQCRRAWRRRPEFQVTSNSTVAQCTTDSEVSDTAATQIGPLLASAAHWHSASRSGAAPCAASCQPAHFAPLDLSATTVASCQWPMAIGSLRLPCMLSIRFTAYATLGTWRRSSEVAISAQVTARHRKYF